MQIPRIIRYSVLALLFASASCNSTPTAGRTAPGPTTRELAATLKANPAVVADSKKTLARLASEEFEGRGVGTDGIDRAAEYIAHRFADAGLQKLPGQDSYYQPFDYTVSIKLDPATALKLNDKALAVKKDFTPTSSTAQGAFDAPIVFVGYGISAQEKHQYDDYAGIDVKGKVVIAMRYEPRDADGKSRFTGGDWSNFASLTAKAMTAAEHGAAALILVNPPNAKSGEPTTSPTTAPSTNPATAPSADAMSSAPTRAPSVARDSLLSFSPRSMSGKGTIPVLHAKRAAINTLLRSARVDELPRLQSKIDRGSKPASFELKSARASGKVAIKRTTAVVKNVMAMLPGTGPRKDEYVIVGAHYDHLGRGMMGSMSPGSKEIHHGADDNASGTTAMIEAAARMAKAGKLDRSVIFIAFTAEEEGLLGSEHFAKNPPVPLEKIAAVLNMDMVGRIRKGVLFVGGSGTAPSFEPMLKKADLASPLQLKFSGPMLGKGGMGPSDHQTFAVRDIPVLFFFSGLHSDYHRPTDTAEKINYTGVAESVALAQHIATFMSSMPKEAYESKFDRHGFGGNDSSDDSGVGTSASAGDGDPPRRASLGVMPDYAASESTTGVRISGARPGSAADKAGLKEGDVITQLGDARIGSIYDLTDALQKASPGDKMKIVVMRDEKRVELEATLTQAGS